MAVQDLTPAAVGPPAERSAGQRLREALGSDWGRFLGSKLVTLVVSFAFLVIVTFLIVQMIPGDPARAVAGQEATLEQVEETRHQLGLDRPIWEQFSRYLGDIFDGTLGDSFRTGTVSEMILVRLPFTLGVAIAAILITLLVSIPLGLVVAVATRGGRRPTLSLVFSWVTAIVDAVPVYVRACILVLVFALWLKLLPAGGAQEQSSYVLPIAALAVGPICSVARVVRREAETVLEADYVRTLRGWRLPPWKIHLKYVLPSLLTSTLTMSGLMLTGMIGGALVMETVFAWPGLGIGVVQAILVKDFPMVQGSILVLGMMAVTINLLVDVFLAVVDPKMLREGKSQ